MMRSVVELALFAGLGLVIYYFIKYLRSEDEQELWSDLDQKITELVNDPFTFERDLSSLIPILEYADQRIARRVRRPKLAKRVEDLLKNDAEETPA